MILDRQDFCKIIDGNATVILLNSVLSPPNVEPSWHVASDRATWRLSRICEIVEYDFVMVFTFQYVSRELEEPFAAPEVVLNNPSSLSRRASTTRTSLDTLLPLSLTRRDCLRIASIFSCSPS